MGIQKKAGMVMTGILMVLALAAIAGAQAKVANAQLQRQIAEERASFGLRTYLAGLQLTQSQKDQVQAILVRYRTEIQSLVRASILARRELNRTIASGTTPTDLEFAFSNAKSTEWDVVKLKATLALEIRNILTAEQIAKLQQRLDAGEARIENLQKRSGK